MDKPIIEGCKAVIVNCIKNKGEIVTVKEYFGDNLPFMSRDKNIWIVDKPMKYDSGDEYYFISESYLQRIDDDEEPSWEAIESITKWNPNKEVVNG